MNSVTYDCSRHVISFPDGRNRLFYAPDSYKTRRMPMIEHQLSCGSSSSSSSARSTRSQRAASETLCMTERSSESTTTAQDDAYDEQQQCLRMTDVLEDFEQQDDVTEEKKTEAYRLLLRILKNVVTHPEDSRYRRIRDENAHLRSKLSGVSLGKELMIAGGFRLDHASCTWVLSPQHDPIAAWGLSALESHLKKKAEETFRNERMNLDLKEEKKRERERVLQLLAQDKREREAEAKFSVPPSLHSASLRTVAARGSEKDGLDQDVHLFIEAPPTRTVDPPIRPHLVRITIPKRRHPGAEDGPRRVCTLHDLSRAEGSAQQQQQQLSPGLERIAQRSSPSLSRAQTIRMATPQRTLSSTHVSRQRTASLVLPRTVSANMPPSWVLRTAGATTHVGTFSAMLSSQNIHRQSMWPARTTTRTMDDDDTSVHTRLQQRQHEASNDVMFQTLPIAVTSLSTPVHPCRQNARVPPTVPPTKVTTTLLQPPPRFFGSMTPPEGWSPNAMPCRGTIVAKTSSAAPKVPRVLRTSALTLSPRVMSASATASRRSLLSSQHVLTTRRPLLSPLFNRRATSSFFTHTFPLEQPYDTPSTQAPKEVSRRSYDQQGQCSSSYCSTNGPLRPSSPPYYLW